MRISSRQLVFPDNELGTFARGQGVFFPIRRTENLIPKPASDAEVYIRELMMNEVVGPEFPIPPILEMEMMMNVMEDAVENESSR